MNRLTAGACAFVALTMLAPAESFLDRVDEALTISVLDDQLRMRLSGWFDLEYYHFDSPAPGLVFSDDHDLFNPRLTLFLDVQLGAHLYGFVQGRIDRGFDPSESGARARVDEYALRLTPWEDGRFNLQVGQFATIVGNWATRHGSWENPFVTAPLPYENLTGIWDSEPAYSAQELFSWSHVSDGRGGFYGDEYSDKELRLPVVWGPAYTAGFAVFGKIGKFEYAADFKNSALSSRPEYWTVKASKWENPKISARIGFRPNELWSFGVSGSAGSYLEHDAKEILPRGKTLDDYRQLVLAQDVSFAWHRWQVWAECYLSRFEIPNVGNADTLVYYVEAKYKFTPQFFAAVRWNQQFYNRIEGQRWGRDMRRVDVSGAFRFTPHTQLKLQYTLEDETGPRGRSHGIAVQYTLRF